MEDFQLTRTALEKRVRELLEICGFVVERGRHQREDWIVTTPDDWLPNLPIAVEVKSMQPEKPPGERSPIAGVSPTRTHLRQLDDYVFDLSGEKAHRKRGVTAWANPLIRDTEIGGRVYPDTSTVGAVGYRITPPNSHKGLLVFNGPADTPFKERPENWLRKSAAEFANERSFCVISLENLISWSEVCLENETGQQRFWGLLCWTCGECPTPEDFLQSE